ncbi:CusA/CzcA family heavy metal efflux RND transporter [Larkinella sp. C7]|uniref:CusA/CzcA family heavy metal efflux RND transporter n=1 Tax=Larkinella sp. C7 TaxID=2576607 RepID=UPI0011112497|nr:CusA/CzcA family heavy metal efflux RND transporter [Larkinella sp. C7]
MLDRIIHFSIYNKLIIGIFTLALIAWGSYSVTQLPIDAVPDITDNQVMVITITPTLAAQEVERLITFPVEQTMASIPQIDQMRSFSRFGLSIVTIVFKENTDIYWARQQIGERLSEAGKQIPAGVGTPEMAPVTTGLGEIYQYVIHPEKGYEKQYDAMALRTIQDWVVKRQLLGTPGVAEVSGFGGYVKEYEIAVNPDKLQSMGVTITDIFNALEKNNQNTGGAYINKNPTAYFIRSEGLVKNLGDLGKIVVKNTESAPIFIRDVATVRFGNSVRYGAATRNGEGETVTGIVMMLKGANSSEVIDNVKERIEQIKKTLPEGVTIEPFLDRKKLVDSAIQTVGKNLIEGALIVIFILILFLGNLRAGLVVASVIPLAMLFAISMMNLFGVSGNLMSLGAIDFGLIVDGAVIIVEATLHHIVGKKYTHRLSQQEIDDEVYHATVNIRSSAAFGEIIILMVYLPLCALVGIEGKMFRPMAQTVSFAILGAFILSLTYVPMMAALGLSKKTNLKPTISDRMMHFFQRLYTPVLRAAMRVKAVVVLLAVGLFVISLLVLSRLGGEFIPQLDEGDFAVETRVLTGSSIDQMLDVSKKAQKIILKFPEVKQVVNKIGSGEIPTDPMPIEAGDMMIILKEKSEWTSASSREELAEKMQQALAVIPNATFGFQQPIQMRFNELITGAKQDVVLKVYGEDLDVLSQLAGRIGTLIRHVDGVQDLYVEEVTGQPQIQIDFDRDKIAQYGLTIDDVNQVIRTGFAGEQAGLVYEGERRFALVVRLDTTSRRDIQDVRNLYMNTPSGRQIPLQEVATVEYKEGPNQIQRDNAKRRITLGFNVRSRDVESIVGDIQQIIDTKMKLPVGYYVTYGGQFENLRAAKERLSVAVPVALALILLLLYFTFHSISQSLLIFTAIPLSAIGGVFALYFLGLPFSISAGVGFIALFGVSVLNGIVLIGEFNRLEKEGVREVYQRVIQGTQIRLRPVLMTAAVASLGFLPMALSQGSGAEVQRPLATVVIGGLISATLLTLIVLPVLYIYLATLKPKKPKVSAVSASIGLVTFLFSGSLLGQPSVQQRLPESRVVTLEQAIELALKNNTGQKIAAFETDREKELKKAAINLPKTDFLYSQGNINSQERDNSFNITQRLAFPTLYESQRKLAMARVESSQWQQAVRSNDLIRNVKAAYARLVYFKAKQLLFTEQDSIYSGLQKASALRYQSGETNQLEKATSAAQAMEVKNQLLQNQSDLTIASQQLQTLLNTREPITTAEQSFAKRTLTLALPDSNPLAKNPLLQYLKQQIAVGQQQVLVEKQKKLPEIIVGYTNQSFRGVQIATGNQEVFTLSDRFSVVHAGVAIPLFPGGYRATASAAKISEQIAHSQLEYENTNLSGEFKALVLEYAKVRSAVDYYENTALPQARLITVQAQQGFRSGETSYPQFLQSLSVANRIKSDYLDKLYFYNLAIQEIETLAGLPY